MAQARGGNLEVAALNFQACLPSMIQTLRIPSGGYMFEYADNPRIRYGKHEPSDQELVVKMINRLRIITGRNFGYDAALTNEQNEAAIAAWEQWFQMDGKVRFTPDAEQLPVPIAPDPGQADTNDSPIVTWIKDLGYGRKSNQEIASKYDRAWLAQITDVGTWLKIGFALYDVERYDDALAAFRKMEELAAGDQRGQVLSLIWQGHMLDLLGRRREAIAEYREAADRDIKTYSQRHDQFGLVYSPTSYARERMSTPFTRVENLCDD